MPQAAKTLCVCGGIKTAGVCSRCGPTRPTRNRTGKGGEYGGSWKRLSEKAREQQPWCTLCFHRQLITTKGDGRPLHCHHIIPVLVRPDLRDDPDNRLVMCQSCNVECDNLYSSNRAEYDRLMRELKKARDSF